MDEIRRGWVMGLAAFLVMPSTLMRPASGQEGRRKVIAVRMVKRKIVSPKGAIRVSENDVIELHWESDEATILHLHGYDRKFQVRPGETAILVIKVNATGRFPITSHGWGHGGHGALIHLEVYPR